jgi:3-oxoacyl-[acyl-carrier protein] reductase
MNKIILILGSSSDIGISLIKKIHMDYDVIIAHYNSDNKRLNDLKETIGDKLHIMQADFSSEQNIINLIENIENKIGHPTHIVHLPAAKVKNINFHKSDWRLIESDINISLRSIYLITQHCIKSMMKMKYGKIVIMLSSCTITIPKFMLDYTVVKYALLGFMKSIATEYADKAININAI